MQTLQLIPMLLFGCQPLEFEDSSMWAGFHYEWEELSHRLSLVQTQLHQDGAITMGMIGALEIFFLTNFDFGCISNVYRIPTYVPSMVRVPLLSPITYPAAKK